ncbi:MAG: hypothetical protein U0169_17090 [Polyangiaceae bacterium]
MAFRKRNPSQILRRAAERTVVAGSWMALVAATTLGLGNAESSRAFVRAEKGLRENGVYRLIVQSYGAVGDTKDPSAKPIASAQRAVTASELREGVQVSLVEFHGEDGSRASGASASSSSGPVVVAWVEKGEPDLEFDGRTARPKRGSMVGTVRRAHGAESVEISLKRA